MLLACVKNVRYLILHKHYIFKLKMERISIISI